MPADWKCCYAERSERIDELNAKLEQLRAANEKLAEMVRLPSGPPSLDAA